MISVFFDLDGVLADFVRGVLKVHGREDVRVRDVPWGLEAKLGIEPAAFWAPMGYDFWANLKVLDDGLQLLRRVEKAVDPSLIGIMTTLCETDGCADGKRAWVKRYLPEYRKRLHLVTGTKELSAGPQKILIDDHEPNVHKWHSFGGLPLLVPRPWNGLDYQCYDEGWFDVDRLMAGFDANLRVATSA